MQWRHDLFQKVLDEQDNVVYVFGHVRRDDVSRLTFCIRNIKAAVYTGRRNAVKEGCRLNCT
jgi:hypothetical protein